MIRSIFGNILHIFWPGQAQSQAPKPHQIKGKLLAQRQLYYLANFFPTSHFSRPAILTAKPFQPVQQF
jgi:hypothetical protein